MPDLLEARINELMGKEVIVTRLFEFGGSNAHLKTLIKYFGANEVILLLEEQDRQHDLQKITGSKSVKTKVMYGLHRYAHLAHPSTLSNIREAFMVTWSIVRVLLFCLRNNVGGITVNTVDPEKHLYFFWIPFIRVRYLVHSTPQPRFTFFTTFTCNHLLGKGKRIITVSRANRAAVCKAWDISEKKASFVNVIYNCVDRAGGGVHRSADGSATRDIITMGHLVGYKNPGTWLKTAITITRQFTDVRFIWLGNGELFEEYKKKAGPGEKILFPGLADDPYPYLDKAAIYYQPSLHETHGIAVLEAMSCHLPCVVSETGGLPESVTDGFNGFLVPPVDADSHVAALKKLILDPELCREFGSNGYQQYLERFTFDKFCAEMDRLYLQ